MIAHTLLARPSALLALTIALLSQGARQRVAEPVTLARGAVYWQQIDQTAAGAAVVNVLRIDLDDSSLKVEAAFSRPTLMTQETAKGRGPLGDAANRPGIIAAVNADFFDVQGTARPLGMTIQGGALVTDGLFHRSVFGLTRDGKALLESLGAVGVLSVDGVDQPVTLDGLNRQPTAAGELTLMTPQYGAFTTVGASWTAVRLGDMEGPIQLGKPLTATVIEEAIPTNSSLPLTGPTLLATGERAVWLKQFATPGAKISLRFDPVRLTVEEAANRGTLPSRRGSIRVSRAGLDWASVQEAVGGGPWLVRDGRVYIDAEEERFSVTEFRNKRHPRTAVGVTADNRLLLITVDGRQSFSAGMTLEELANCLIRLGAVRAINLDGGGSTAMVVRGVYVNSPSDGSPRNISSSLVVRTTEPIQPPVQEELEPLTVSAGETLSLSPKAVKSGVWGSSTGTAWVDQAGHLTALKAGIHRFVSVGSDRAVFQPVTISPGAPASIRVTKRTVPNNPPDRTGLAVWIVDRFGNPVPGQTIRISAPGGQPDPAQIASTTNRTDVELIWNEGAARTVTVSSGTLPPVTVSFK